MRRQAGSWGQQQPAAAAWGQQAQPQAAADQNKDVTLIVTGCTHATVGGIVRGSLVGVSSGAFLNIEPSIFPVWEPSSEAQPDLSFNLPLQLLKTV